MTTGKVLKDRRSPRERGRMGSSLTNAPASTSAAVSALETFHSCARPRSGPRSTTATLTPRRCSADATRMPSVPPHTTTSNASAAAAAAASSNPVVAFSPGCTRTYGVDGRGGNCPARVLAHAASRPSNAASVVRPPAPSADADDDDDDASSLVRMSRVRSLANDVGVGVGVGVDPPPPPSPPAAVSAAARARARGERDAPRTRRPASGATRGGGREEEGVDVDVDAAESLVVAESAESDVIARARRAFPTFARAYRAATISIVLLERAWTSRERVDGARVRVWSAL